MKAIPDVYYHMDEPTADGCAIAVYFLSRLASKDVKSEYYQEKELMSSLEAIIVMMITFILNYHYL